MGTRGAGIVVVRVQTNLVVQTAMHIVQSNVSTQLLPTPYKQGLESH